MRRLIINADDLGLTEGVNRAILRAHQDGVVTSTTLMANGAALQDAVSRLRSLPSTSMFSVGCHLSLVDGRSLSAPDAIPSLLAAAGEFRQGVGELGVAAQCGRLSAAEIEIEATEQFRALQAAGIEISHFDAHKHAHMFRGVLEPALKAAAACGIQAVRNPFESLHPLPLSVLWHYPKLLKRYMQVELLRSMRSNWRRIVQQFGFATTNGSLGIIVTGDLDERLLHVVLESMPEGTWELVCHPGYNDAELAGIRTRLRESRAQEIGLLTSPDTRRLINDLGIELISYRQL